MLGNLVGHNHAILCVAVSQRSLPIIVTGDGGGTVIGWDLANFKLIGKRQSSTSAVRAIAISQGRKTLVVIGRQDGTLQIVALRSGQLIRSLVGHSEAIRALDIWGSTDDEDPPLVVSGSTDCSIKIWNLLSGEELLQLKEKVDEICAMAVTQGDGLTVVSVGTERIIKIWKELKIVRSTVTNHQNGNS